MNKYFWSCLIALPLLMGCIDRKNVLSETEFKNPPQWAKPRTWMHAMSGNMTKEGMTKDLESISNVGIGGILLFNIAQGIPYGNITYNSDEHHEILKHTAQECERLGLSFGFHNCAGWSSSGGPWIRPEESMKMLAYRQVIVDGGHLDIQLPQPTMRENFYRDIAVLAYPSLLGDIQDARIIPKISSTDNRFDISVACDGRVDNFTKLNKDEQEDAYILFDYGQSISIGSVYMSTMDRNGQVELWVSDDGIDFRKKRDLTQVRVGKGEWCFLDSFESIEGRYFKLLSKTSLSIKEVKLSALASIDDYLNKNCMGRKDDERIEYSQMDSKNMIIKKESIVDLTAGLSAKGRLNAELPEGKWTIMRIGYTSTGAFNHPASDSGRGLECDKFSKLAIEKHFEAFSRKIINKVKSVAPNALQYIELDSYEMGGQNWTDDFEQIFKNKKGYELRSFLPLILGKYIDDIQTSEVVLADFREVCCDLMNENYFGRFTELCHEYGLKCYLEPYGNGPFDHLEVGGMCDIPMGEFWMNRSSTILGSAVSSAHIYGKNIVSAESFTSFPEINWKGHPAMAKPSGDRAWKEGVNEFMFHRYTHQANTHVRPGMTMNRWGFHFDRTQTWWDNAGKDWFKYMARGSYMLRQGVPVSDVLVFVGDGSPSSAPKGNYLGLKSDAVNADVLINRISVKDKKMILPEGTTYQILVLRNCERLNLNTLKRICELAESGVPVIGELPSGILGYKNAHAHLWEMQRLTERIRKCPNYYIEKKLEELLEKEKIERDFYVHNDNKILMDYAHRHLAGGGDIYFISNPDSICHFFVCDFRISGKEPELWYAMNGEILPANVYEMKGDRTLVKIDLESYESVFVVFRNSTSKKERNVCYHSKQIALKELNTDWNVEFLKSYGYDSTVHFSKLYDWSISDNKDIKYYSGTAIYRKLLNVDKNSLSLSNEAILDLGEIHIAAEVYVNNKLVCLKWMPPFTMNIYDYLKSGENEIEIHVTNQWTNRLIGDERYPKQDGGYVLESQFPKGRMPEWYIKNEPMPKGPRITFCTGQFYSKNSPLIKAGLIGPVDIKFLSISKK